MQPSEPAICVETNWIIDIILGRDAGAGRMLDLAREGRIAVYTPSFCLAEAVKVVENQRETWRGLAASIETQERQLRAASALAFDSESLREIRRQIAAVRDRVETELWSTLERVSQYARLIEIRHDTIVRSQQYRDLWDLSPADAMVLAAVMQAQAAGTCHTFLTKNARDFATPELLVFLERHGTTLLFSPAEFLRLVRPRP